MRFTRTHRLPSRLRLAGIAFVIVCALSLSLSEAAVAQPPNDNFANAQVLSGSTARVTGTNEDATREPGEPDDEEGNGPSVWYRWAAPTDGAVIIDTCGSGFDTVLLVYTGSALGDLRRVTSDDDGCADEQSRVTFTASAGTTYWIAVDGWDEDEWGNIVLYLRPPPKARPGRYSGRTEDSDPFRFTLSSSLRQIIGLRAVGVELLCTARGVTVGRLRGTVAFPRIRVSANGSFRYVMRRRQGRARLYATVIGRLRPPSRATGTLNVRVYQSILQCRSFPGPMEWSARHP